MPLDCDGISRVGVTTLSPDRNKCYTLKTGSKIWLVKLICKIIRAHYQLSKPLVNGNACIQNYKFHTAF